MIKEKIILAKTKWSVYRLLDHIFYLGAISCIGKAKIVPIISPNWTDIPQSTPESYFYDGWHILETRIDEEPMLIDAYSQLVLRRLQTRIKPERERRSWWLKGHH